MSNDPNSYRVPVLRLGDVFSNDEEKEKVDPFGDSAVTGLGWTVAGDTATTAGQPADTHSASDLSAQNTQDLSHSDSTTPTTPPSNSTLPGNTSSDPIRETNTSPTAPPPTTPAPTEAQPHAAATPAPPQPTPHITPTTQKPTTSAQPVPANAAPQTPTPNQRTVPPAPAPAAAAQPTPTTGAAAMPTTQPNTPRNKPDTIPKAQLAPTHDSSRTPKLTPTAPTPTASAESHAPTPPQHIPAPAPTSTPTNRQSDARAETPDVWASVDPRPERVVHRAAPKSSPSPEHEPVVTPSLKASPQPATKAEPTQAAPTNAQATQPAPKAGTPTAHNTPATPELEQAPVPSLASTRPTLNNPGEEPPDLWEQATAQVPKPTPAQLKDASAEERREEPAEPTPNMTPRAAAYQAQQGSNLDALRQRVAAAQDGATQTSEVPSASKERKSQLGRSNVQALQQGLTILGDTPDTAHDAPHAQAIADVAQKLRTLRGDAATQQAAQEHTAQQTSPAPQAMGAPALMRTFKQDVEQAVGTHSNSIVQMVAAQQDAQAAAGASTPAHTGFSPGLYILLTISILLILGAVGIVGVLLTNGFFDREPSSMIQPSNTITYELDDHTRSEIMRDLVLVRDDAAAELQVGEIMNLSLTEEIYDATTGDDVARQANARTIFERLGFRAPDGLLRAVERPIMVGLVETESGTAPFIILQVQSYEFALAGMLNWEPALSGDLHPFFPKQPIPDGIAARTLSETPFTDRVVANIPTRILESTERDVVLLWSIPDDRLVITTNERAFRLLWERLRL